MRRLGLSLAVAAVLAWAIVVRIGAVSPQRLEPHGGSMTFTDRAGAPLGTILSADDSHTVAVPMADISPHFLDAIVAAEDGRFYHHGPVDWLALGRAFAQDAQCLCARSGASTITMQLAGAVFRVPSGVRGKFAQVWDAFRIGWGANKTQILQAYVNRVAMGENIYGVEAAARDYFGVPASDLDLAQASLLAGIPQDPVGYDPRAHWAAARERQRYVLARMVARGMISARQAALARREQVHLRPAGDDLVAAQQLLFRLAAEHPDARSPLRTTIDLPLQRFVQAQAQEVVAALAGRNVTQAAALVVDNHTGDVLAYVGSTDYFDDAYLGRNDGVQALRQPGSALKPLLYEYALERHVIGPRTILADVPATYAIPGGELYRPQDYSRRFAGPVSVRIALANSLNIPAVRVLSRVGVPAFLNRLRELGFVHLRRSPDYYGLGLTLGAGEVTLWDLTRAYVTLARAGNAIPLRTVAGGGAPEGVQIGDPRSWRRVTAILSDRYARALSFGVGSVIDMPFPVAVKTGTSSGFRDTWTVGYTPQYTVGVWVGNFTGVPMRHVAGVSGAGPLWNRIMLHLYATHDPPPFPHLRAARAVPRPVRQLPPIYDEWRAAQGLTTGPLQILFPRDGDLFEDALAPNDPRRAQQQIAFRISRPKGARVTWLLDGATLARSSGDSVYWIVRPGRFTLQVRTAGAVARAHFTVVARRPHALRGFALVSR